MRTVPHARRTHKSQVKSVSVPSPIGGWNARDPLALMNPTEAVALDNLMPQTSFCELRGGYAEHGTGMTGNGKTLAVHNGVNNTNKMFAVTTTDIYDVSSAGAASAQSEGTFGNAKFQWTMFSDGTNNWLIMVNGADEPEYYDGTSWTKVTGVSSPAITGVTTTSLVHVMSHKGRLYFIENNKLAFLYLPAGFAGGAVQEYDLGGEAVMGGFLMAMGSWSRDAGDGMDDVAVFVTSKGEAIVYQGHDPGSVNAWFKVGSFFVGEPLGRRCLREVGGDLVILTQNGAFSIHQALQSGDVNYKLALSYKIENEFTTQARTTGSTFGWEVINYPARNALIVNVPIAEDGIHYQYVMNTITKAWCRFLCWDAETFVVFDQELYFADGTIVYKAWTGSTDDGADVEGFGKQAFNYFGLPGRVKKITLFRTVLTVDGPINFSAGIEVDFNEEELFGTVAATIGSEFTWDVSNWDQANWAAGPQTVKQWSSPAQWEGYCFAGKLKFQTDLKTVRWVASDYVMEVGEILS